VTAAVEIAGLDIPEMGLSGYPDFVAPTPVENVPATEVAAAKATIPALAKA
jgi:hypothetical protein